MEQMTIHLFGKFQLRVADQEVEDVGSAKAQELLCYLLLHGEKFHHREAVANILWRKTSATRSKQYLRRALWQLQNVLAGWQASSDHPLILVDDDWIKVNLHANVWVDALQFREICLRHCETPGQNLDQVSAGQMQEAVQLCHSQLLDGWYQDWCLLERERFRRLFLRALDKLMLFCEMNGAYETGVEYGVRILRHDPAREHTHRRLMRLYYLSGNRVDALRQYDRCAAILAKELAIEPMHTTRKLREQIQAAQAETLPASAQAPDALTPHKHQFLRKVHDELRHLRSVLKNIERHVQHQIDLVETELGSSPR